MKALLLAAGFATRLYPLTKTQAKPLLEIGGKPMLTRLVEKLSELPEIEEFVVVGNEKFAGNFEDWRAGIAAARPVRVLNDGSTDDDNKLGAIGDIGFALDRMEGDGELVVVAGDNLFEFSPVPFFEEFRRRGQPLLLLREIAHRAENSRYNEVFVDDDGIVTSFREKPADPNPASNLVAICFYFLPAGAREWVRQYLAGGGNPDAPGYFIEWLVKQTPVRAMRFEGTWFDIGNLQTLEQAREKYASRR